MLRLTAGEAVIRHLGPPMSHNVELSGWKDRCTSAAQCKYFPIMSNFTRRFESMHRVWSFALYVIYWSMSVTPECTIDVCVSVLEATVDTPLSSFIFVWYKLSDSLGVLKVHVTKYCFLHVLALVRRHGNSTFGTFYVELLVLKDRCTSAAEC